MLYLDQYAIDHSVSMKEIIDGIDSAYTLYNQGDYTMPTRTQLKDSQNTLIMMPCFIQKYIATKLITIFPNSKETVQGTVILNCNESGATKASMDGTHLTAVRTGAIGGNAVRHLAKKAVSNLAVIGTGVQGFHQTVAACEEREFKNIYVFNRTKGKKVTDFVKKLADELGNDVCITVMDSAENAIRKAEVVITATNSSDPVLPNDKELLKNKLFIGIGSFQTNMQEFPEALYKSDPHVLVDSNDAIKESGDIAVPLNNNWLEEDNIHTMDTFIKNPWFDVENNDHTILFKSTGMALFDAVIAAIIYEASNINETTPN